MYKILLVGLFSIALFAEERYIAPPSERTIGYVPAISDEEMKVCVERYNQAERLEKELKKTKVNQYSKREVNNYNAKVEKIRSLVDWFNANCAGKQSRSACEAAKQLNKEKGIPYQDCD